MKKLLLLVLGAAMVMSANVALAQGGYIVLYADNTQSSCNATDTGAGFVLIYAFQEDVSAKASRWALENNGHNMTHFLDQACGTCNPFGSGSQGGWAIGYGGCQPAPFLMATVWYQGSGVASDPCSNIRVVPDPNEVSGEITGSSCADVLTFPGGSILTINEDGNCLCGRETPVETTTWGQVKALYE